MKPIISVCIITRRRSRQLDACLASLQAQESPPPFEVLVGSHGDPSVAPAVLARYPDAIIGEVRRALPGGARNLLVQRARGQILLFLDDDVTAEPRLLNRLATLAAAHPEISVFGGPNLTPPDSSRFQVVQGAVLGSLVASGPTRRRYGRHRAGSAGESSFILCNLAVRREAMLPFANDLMGAEENGLLDEIARRGLVMHYDPHMVVYHERRASLRGFAQQMTKYGRGRGQLIARAPRTLRCEHLVPATLVLYLTLLPVLVALNRTALVPLLIYLLVVAGAAVRVSTGLHHLGRTPLAAALIVVLHVCYGVGVLWGLLGRRRRRPQPEWTDLTDRQPEMPGPETT